MHLKRLFSVALVALLAVPPSAPASPSSTLSGLVTSAQGAPLARLNLDLLNLDTGRVVVAQTDGTGAFRVNLDPGLYTVDAGRSGYKLARGPQVVRLGAGQVMTANLALANSGLMLPRAAADSAPKVSVTGEVHNPGSFPFTAGTTVRQAIALAGGMTDSANLENVTVRRGGREMAAGPDDPLSPGDTVIVHKKSDKKKAAAVAAGAAGGIGIAGLSTAATVALAAAAVGVTTTAIVVSNNKSSPSTAPTTTPTQPPPPPTQPPPPPTQPTEPPPPPPTPRPRPTATPTAPPPQSVSR